MCGAIIIVGAFYGDEGKGKMSAYYSHRERAKLVCRAGTGSNAEHGIYPKDESVYIKTNQLPLGWMMDQNVQIRIGSGVAVNPGVLFKEIEKYHLQGRVKIDYRCPITSQEDVDAEKESKHHAAIGSTFSGTGFTRARFVMRKAQQARNILELKDMLIDLGEEINREAILGTVVVECSQGTMLSLAISPDYPNVTSDNVTSVAAMDDVLLNWKKVKDVVLVVKSIPSREGAGGMGSSKELTLEEIQERGWVEESSIGGVTRRKADGIDWEMLRYVAEINGATKIALTFLDQFDPQMKDVIDYNDITDKTWNLIEKVENITGIPVEILDTGKAYDRIIDLSYGRDLVNWDKIDIEIENLKKLVYDN